jgi:hypothetical protein
MNPRAHSDEIVDDLAARDPRVALSQKTGMPCIEAGGKPPHPRWLNQPPASSSR